MKWSIFFFCHVNNHMFGIAGVIGPRGKRIAMLPTSCNTAPPGELSRLRNWDLQMATKVNRRGIGEQWPRKRSIGKEPQFLHSQNLCCIQHSKRVSDNISTIHHFLPTHRSIVLIYFLADCTCPILLREGSQEQPTLGVSTLLTSWN